MANGKLNIDSNLIIDHMGRKTQGLPFDDLIQSAIEQDDILKDAAEGVELYLSENEGNTERLKALLQNSKKEFMKKLEAETRAKPKGTKRNLSSFLLVLMLPFMAITRVGSGGNLLNNHTFSSKKVELENCPPEEITQPIAKFEKKESQERLPSNGLDDSTFVELFTSNVPAYRDSIMPTVLDMRPLAPIRSEKKPSNFEPLATFEIKVLEKFLPEAIEVFEEPLFQEETLTLSPIKEEFAFSAFPSPFTNTLNVSFKIPESVKQVKVMVTDVAGRNMAMQQSESKGVSKLDFQMLTSAWVAGIYYISIIADGKLLRSQKIAKK